MDGQAKEARESGAEATRIALATAQAAQKSADAAKSSADALMKSERAWLLVEKVWLGTDDIFRESVPWKDMVVRCEAKNYGRTPTRVLDVRAMIEFGVFTDPSQVPLSDRVYDSKGLSVARWVVLPDKKQVFSAPLFDIAILGEQLLRTGDAGVCFIHGTIEYWDMFSETRRTTVFCFRSANHRDSPQPGQDFVREGGDRYNQQT